MPPPSAPYAAKFLFWLCVAACVVGEMMILRAAVRRGSMRDLAWSLVPAIALALLLAASWARLPV